MRVTRLRKTEDILDRPGARFIAQNAISAEASITALIVLQSQLVFFSTDELGAARWHGLVFSSNLPRRSGRARF